ncbi:unnamed protein product [Larinioides sclopetarius]|uniref:BTB domain-containing protein n=1 Tax=Larinioides sclopetarius TaxID=280406 RepID=A0AAV2AFQ8_9ARAC
MTKFSITTKILGIRWTVEKVSEVECYANVLSPDFSLGSENECCIIFKVSLIDLFVFIRNKSAAKIEIQRTLVLYDGNNKKLHEETDEKIFSLEKNVDVNILGKVGNRCSFNTLINDRLIIDLRVNVKEITTNRLTRDIDPGKKLREDLKTMLENSVNSDVSLQVGNERIPVHWSILCSRSPYFKEMFDSGMQERVQNSVIIADSSLGTVQKLIQFLYTADFVQGDDLQELFDLYYAADKYEVVDLRTLCGHKILSNATIDNVCEILRLFHRHNDKALKSEVVDFIRLHSDAIFETEGWKKFEVSEPVVAEFISFCLKKN